MKIVTAAVIGAGDRGASAYAGYASDSHVICFAAGKSQFNSGAVIDLSEFAEKLRKGE